MVSSIGSTPYSYSNQLKGVKPSAPTASTAPVADNSATTGGSANKVSLSSLVLSLLQSTNSTDNSSNDLFQTTDTKNPSLNLLLAKSQSSLYKTAYVATQQKALHDSHNPPAPSSVPKA